MKKLVAAEKESRITYQLSFESEEEGVLSLYQEGVEQLRFAVYPLGEGEAELAAQDVGLLKEVEKEEKIQEKIILQITKLIIEAVDAMEEEGVSNPLIVVQKATYFEEILSSTSVVRKEYSELMMKSPDKTEETTSSCVQTGEIIRYSKTEDGYECRNREESFFARVSPYKDGWYVYEVEVLCDKRRTGIGSRCMRVLMERFPQLYLQVGSYNEPAMQLYKKLGFQVIEELCYYGRK